MEETKLGNWIEESAAQSRKEREEAMAASGMKPFLQLQEGETRFTIDRGKQPRIVQTDYGELKVLSLTEPAEKELGCTAYLFSVVIEQLAAQADGRIRLLRTGQGKATKYKCLPV